MCQGMKNIPSVFIIECIILSYHKQGIKMPHQWYFVADSSNLSLQQNINDKRLWQK